MDTRQSLTFPDINLPSSEKDEKWHKDYITAIVNNAIDDNYEMSYSNMQESYNFFDGIQDDSAVKFLQQTEAGDTLPALWMNFNSIRVKFEALDGELQSRGYSIRVNTVNKDAIARKLELRQHLLASVKTRQLAKYAPSENAKARLMQEYEVPNKVSEEDDVHEFMDESYKEEQEEVMNAVLRSLNNRYELQKLRSEWLRDIFCTSRAFAKADMEDGIPKYRRIDPRYMVFDKNAKDDFLSDATYFGEVRYMPLSEATQIFELTREEVEQIKNTGKNSLHSASVAGSPIGNSTIRYVQGSGNDLKVLVFYAEWQDNMTVKRKKSVDKYGNEHYKKVPDKAKGNDIVSKRVKAWRKGVLIGGKILKDWGLCKDMPRSVDDIYNTTSSYISLCHGYVNFRTVSKVDMVKALQTSKNIAMYNLQLAMNRAGTKGFMYDVSTIPDGWNTEDVIQQLKTVGIGFFNSRKDGMVNPSTGIHEFDMTISATINQYISIAQMYDAEINRITGINEARQGATAANMAVGLAQQQLSASQFSTEPMFNCLNTLCEKLFNRVMGLVKVSWVDKDNYAFAIGEAGVDFIKQETDLTLDDFDAKIEVTPPMIVDQQKFDGYVHAALQTGQITLADALSLLREKDLDSGIEKLEKKIEKKAKEDREAQIQQQLMVQQQQQMAEQKALQIQAMQRKQEEDAKLGRMTQQINLTHQNRMREKELEATLKGPQQVQPQAVIPMDPMQGLPFDPTQMTATDVPNATGTNQFGVGANPEPPVGEDSYSLPFEI